MSSAPRDHYQSRRAFWDARVASLTQTESQFTRGRLAVGLLLAAAGFLTFGSKLLHPAIFFVLLFALAALIVAHEAAVRRRQYAERGRAFTQKALDRLDGAWPGQGTGGDQFRDAHHVFSEDLDVFGRGSLFELICTARTAGGQSLLARWLLAPAAAAEARLRQQAVRELIPFTALREDLSLLGEQISGSLHPDTLRAWGSAPLVAIATGARVTALAIAAFVAVSFFAWLLGQAPLAFFLSAFLLAGGFQMLYRNRVEHIVHALDSPAHELKLAAALLARLESETFASPLLRDRTPHASRAIQDLQRIVERLDWAHNLGFAPVAFVILWVPLQAFAVERWRARYGKAIGEWFDSLALFEALASLANYAFEHPSATFPELLDSGPTWEASDLTHPLIPESRAVANSLRLDGSARLWIVSGSNMSGKSTLLRSVGLNTILAWSGAPVRAARLQLSLFQLGASIRTMDSVMEGRSRFFAEITRLRQIVDLTAQQPPLLFLLDELLSGTNSHDRRLGAEGILKALLERGALGLVSTHDLALTEIADGLAAAGNIHFEDQVEQDSIHFDYTLRPGVVNRSNALALMRSIGLP